MVVSVLVREVMTPDVITEPPDATIDTAVTRLRTEDVGSIVVTENDAVVGIVTDDDFISLLTAPTVSTDGPVSQIMSTPVETVVASASIMDAAGRLRDDEIDQLPVVEDDTLVGLISVADLATFFPQYLLTQLPGGATGETRDWSYEYDDIGSSGISVGDTVRFTKTITAADVAAFARISGDENPLHVDESFARQTRFDGRVAPGLLVASLFSAALARFPGLVIYLSQNVRFLEPVDIGTDVTVVCEIIQDLQHDRYRLSTSGYDEGDEQVLLGEAVILVDPMPEDDGQTLNTV